MSSASRFHRGVQRSYHEAADAGPAVPRQTDAAEPDRHVRRAQTADIVSLGAMAKTTGQLGGVDLAYQARERVAPCGEGRD
jgi:hypothetical protein